MLKHFIPIAVLFSAPLLSTATPVLGLSGEAAATITIYQCPDTTPTGSVSIPTSVDSSSVITAVAGGATAVPVQITSLLSGLRQLSTLTNGLTSTLNSLGSTLSSVTNVPGGPNGSTDQLQSGLGSLTSQLNSLTSGIGGVNGILGNLDAGAAGSGDNGDQVSSLAQGLISQIQPLIVQATPLVDGIQGTNSNLNLDQLEQAIQDLQSACLIMFPNLSDQCATPSQGQALTDGWRVLNGLMNACLIKF
ncbi:hypothetical protein C8R43DRAFT_355355 [Mycena crocata]|nr:hypothetical protein C8R43DRAFT_355355 [Mycena crocata]